MYTYRGEQRLIRIDFRFKTTIYTYFGLIQYYNYTIFTEWVLDVPS